jgi:hypothetical protein
MNRSAVIHHLLTVLLLGATTEVPCVEISCSDTVVVDADRGGELVANVCEAAQAASDFLGAAGFDTSAGIVIKLVDTLPERLGLNALACYVHSERCIYLLTPSSSLARTGPAAAQMSRFPFSSWVSHEVAHAIAAANFRVLAPTIQAHEYIAYVTMFSTMPSTARDRLLGAFGGEAFQAEAEITATLFLLAPTQFGAKAYRHYGSLGVSGPAFLRKVLSGQALDRPDGW